MKDYNMKDCDMKDCNMKDYNMQDCNMKDYNMKDYNIEDCNMKECDMKNHTMEDYNNGSLATIAHIENDFIEKFGIPRQSGILQSLESRIVFTPEYRDENAIRGIEGYSHIWLIWGFHQNGKNKNHWSPTVRPPRLGGNTRMGVFATRSPNRPNPIGLSSVSLLRTEQTKQGRVLVVTGADLMNGTPIYDIKPYIAYCDSHPEAISGFADGVKGYALQPVIEEGIMNLILPKHRETILQILSQDPRPAYQQDENRVYGFRYADMNIRFMVRGMQIIVIDIEKIL